MEQLEELRQKAAELLENSADENEHRKFEIIQKILKKDECFLDMDIEHAYAILRDLGVPEESVKTVYMSLI